MRDERRSEEERRIATDDQTQPLLQERGILQGLTSRERMKEFRSYLNAQGVGTGAEGGGWERGGIVSNAH